MIGFFQHRSIHCVSLVVGSPVLVVKHRMLSVYIACRATTLSSCNHVLQVMHIFYSPTILCVSRSGVIPVLLRNFILAFGSSCNFLIYANLKFALPFLCGQQLVALYRIARNT